MTSPHTGTGTLLELLCRHPGISRSYYSGNMKIPEIFSEDFGIIPVMNPEEYLKYAIDDRIYAAFHGHTDSLYLKAILLNKPFEYKFVTTMRDPFKWLRCFFLRGERLEAKWIAGFLELIKIIEINIDNVFIVPFDYLSNQSVDYRLAYMYELYTDYLGLEMTANVEEGIITWPKLGTGNYEGIKELTPEQKSSVMNLLNLTKLYEQIEQIGVNYYDKRSHSLYG